MSINYNKLFNPDKVDIREDISDIYAIMELEEVLFAISEKVIKYRRENNLTQKELAQKLKVNQTMISKLESGDYNPTVKQLYNMSMKLTNSSDLFMDILKNMEDKIKNLSTHKYNLKINSDTIINGYYVSKSKNTNIINMKKYNVVVGGKSIMKNVQAQFQMLDSYVKEYYLVTDCKLSENMQIKANGEVQFRIVNIAEKDEGLIGEIELTNNLELMIEEKKVGEIRIVMGGLFRYTPKEEKEKFEYMLKINGATTLSNFIRTYIHTNTAMSGMPTIITPMINFVEFFNEEN